MFHGIFIHFLGRINFKDKLIFKSKIYKNYKIYEGVIISVKLSIIIPTYNEEEYLPKLLYSIKEQEFKDYEIIVADAGSVDRTREIAESNGCKVIEGGLPAVGRNNGAKIAKGKYFYF